MSDKFFLDTNIFVYSFDRRSPSKARKADDLIRQALATHQGVISTQVVQEFLNVALLKFEQPLSIPDCKLYLSAVMMPLCATYADEELYRSALDIRAATGYSFYDSLIVASAQRSGCKRLFTEDLQSDREINGLRIVNPFRS